MDFINKLKGFLLKPSKTFKKEEKTSVTSAFKYGLIGLVILGILTAILMSVAGSAITAALPITAPITGGVVIIAFFCNNYCWIYNSDN